VSKTQGLRHGVKGLAGAGVSLVPQPFGAKTSKWLRYSTVLVMDMARGRLFARRGCSTRSGIDIVPHHTDVRRRGFTPMLKNNPPVELCRRGWCLAPWMVARVLRVESSEYRRGSMV
jgi:hypothetical protein